VNASEIQELWQDLMPTSSEAPVGLLYHYTDRSGLRGILQSKHIWATHIEYLNDSSEFKHAYSQASTDVLLNTLIPGINEALATGIRETMLIGAAKYDAFVLSFTDDQSVHDDGCISPGDRLSQWRSYGSGGGFSLGFDISLGLGGFDRFDFRRASGTLWFYRCVYKDDERQQLFKSLGARGLQKAFDMYARGIEDFKRENSRIPSDEEISAIAGRCGRQAISSVSSALFIQAGQFKHKAFCEEHEWRVIFFALRETLSALRLAEPLSPILFERTGKSGPVPYIKYPLNLDQQDNPLRRIVVGPCPDLDGSVKEVESLLNANGISGVDVEPSTISYRYW